MKFMKNHLAVIRPNLFPSLENFSFYPLNDDTIYNLKLRFATFLGDEVKHLSLQWVWEVERLSCQTLKEIYHQSLSQGVAAIPHYQ